MDAAYRAMMRRRLLEDIYDRMSEEERRLFVMLTMQDKGHEEIMGALQGIAAQSERNKHSFGVDLLANVTGNAVWDAGLFLLSKLAKSIK